jgi:hypothetical protein
MRRRTALDDALDALSVGLAIAGTVYALVLIVGLMAALGAPAQ